MIINTFDPFPIRVVEEYFKLEDLDDVAGRFFDYLTATYDAISDNVEITNSNSSNISVSFLQWPSSSSNKILVTGKYNIDNVNDKRYYLKITSGTDQGKYYPIISNGDSGLNIDETGINKGFTINQSNLSAEIYLGIASPLRTVNYMDLMNQSIEKDFNEPHFILADVTDYADYQYQDVVVINNGKINTSGGKYRFNAPNGSSSFQTALENNTYQKDILYIRSLNNTGLHEIQNNSFFPISVNKKHNIKIKIALDDETNPSPWTGFSTINPDDGNIFAQIIDKRQGNFFSSNGRLTGRGTISIDIEQKEETNYKITINTLPVFINWAYFIINYLITGTYSRIEEQ